jgi:hypothetical protein
MAAVGGRQVDTNDLGVMAAGAAALLFSFLPYVGVSYKVKGFGGGSAHMNAWHSWAFLGLILVLAAAGAVAARVFADVTLPTLPLGWHVVVAGAAALGTLILLVRGLSWGGTEFSGLGTSYSSGMRWGGYLLVLAGLVETAFAVLALRASGESVSFDRGTPDAPPS